MTPVGDNLTVVELALFFFCQFQICWQVHRRFGGCGVCFVQAVTLETLPTHKVQNRLL